jgi:site-specific DNA-cytosine methylase
MNVTIKHFHLFCGLGGGAAGFNNGHARVGSMEAQFRCIGGIDNDAAAIRDFERLAGVPGTVMDLFDRDQFTEFHGKEPDAAWREATPADVRAAAGGEFPNIVFLSAPCKGFSGLLSQAKSGTDKYQALNRLTLRGVWLALEAFADDLPEMFIFENVPRIATRGRPLLDRIIALLRHYGYAVAETTHDCGELGGLAQSRKRFLLVARNQSKVPAFLYEPDKKPLQPVGSVLGRMLLPGDPAAGPMHRIPRLQWKTWVRLAFVEAGSDWRSLNKLAVQDGYLRDFLIVPDYRSDYLGVLGWEETAGAVSGRGGPSNGRYSIADPRFMQSADWHDGQAYGVRHWQQPSATVTSKLAPGSGYGSVADPRTELYSAGLGVVEWDAAAGAIAGETMPSNGKYAVADPRYGWEGAHQNKMQVTSWSNPAKTITGSDRVGSGALSVADPRCPDRDDYKATKYRITGWDESCGAVIAASTTGNGAFAVQDPRHHGPDKFSNEYRIVPFDREACTVTGGSSKTQCVADPRPGLKKDGGQDWLGGGHYGVIPWTSASGAVSSSAGYDSGRFSVADPRLPNPNDKLVAMIRALDNTWHRPFTTLELAALQGLVDPEEQLELDGLSDSAWRERIGNAVPKHSATAIASVMGEAILLARAGETFRLSASPIWVRPIAVAIAVQGAA